MPVDTLIGVGYPIALRPIGNNEFSLSGLGVCHRLKFYPEKGALEKLSSVLPRALEKGKHLKIDSVFAALDTADFYIDRYKGYTIGYQRYKPKVIRHPKDWPLFFVEDTLTKKRININPKEKHVTSTQQLTSGLSFYHYAHHHTYHDGKIFFNVVSVNKCYIFDTNTKKVSFFRFPKVSGNHACFYQYDFISKVGYAVMKRSKSKYEVYQLSTDFKKASLATKLDFYPEQIIGNKALKVVEVKEGKKKFNCYYLVPLLFADEQQTNLIEGVDVD